ncbi:MAG: HIT family protein [Thaumarchaeota archaeon]|nr:HIT family protein [Nitrososphaerota archaeon]MCL5316850.1 HIT family protein [Nitrososphaerota archaeon]
MTSKGCIFCRIVLGEIPSRKVFEDDSTLAVLDVSPLAPGHTLVIPKTHIERVEDLSPEISNALFSTVQHLTGPIRRSVNAQALTIGINDGREAGQVVPHVHVHLIPRTRSDGGGTIHSIMSRRPQLSDDEMTRIAVTILEEESSR